MIDIVMPNGNEAELAQMGKNLGYSRLLYAYTALPKERKDDQALILGAKIQPGVILIGTCATDLERAKLHYLTDLEKENEPDSYHYRKSGFNQASAKLAQKHKTVFCLNLRRLLTSKEPVQVLGRMMQNARLCRKYGIEVRVVSFATTPYEMRSPKDLQALGRVLGIR